MKFPVAIFFFAAPLLAQNGGIQGTVFDSVTKAPVPGAAVKFTPSSVSVTTGAQGEFHAEAIANGVYRLRITRAGYIANNSVTVQVTNANVQVSAELSPLAQIGGRVSNYAGDPIVSVAVGLRRPWDSNWIVTTISGEDGRFHLPNLEPGTWILAAIPAMRFSFADSAKNPKPIAEPGQEPDQRLGWAATFYPNALQFPDAARIALRPGTMSNGHDIRLRTVPIYRISGTVLDESGKPVPNARLAFSDPANKGANSGMLAADSEGKFNIPAIQDGDWLLFAQSKLGDRTAKGYAAVRVSREDRAGIEIRVAMPFPLSGIVEREEPRDRAGKRKVTGVYLIPQGATADFQTEAFHEQDGSFALKTVYPGRYRVLPVGYVPGYYVASVWYGDQDVTTRDIQIANPPLPLRVVYKSGASSVAGTVNRGEGSTVVFIPQDEALRDAHQFIRTAKCAAGGRFRVESLRPGSYYALAFDRVRPEQLEDVDFVRTLTPLAARVEVRPGESATVELTPRPWPDY